jgi:hypothetical protein
MFEEVMLPTELLGYHLQLQTIRDPDPGLFDPSSRTAFPYARGSNAGNTH